MADRPVSSMEGADNRTSCDSDRCHFCGLRYPESFTRSELYNEADEYRRVQRAAARARVLLDRRLSKITPEWCRSLAAEGSGTPLPDGWEHLTIRRLEEEARERCSCRCHGIKTAYESGRDARKRRNVARSRARLRVILDKRLGSITDEAVRRIAAEEDES